jgi:hypothetical protein
VRLGFAVVVIFVAAADSLASLLLVFVGAAAADSLAGLLPGNFQAANTIALDAITIKSRSSLSTACAITRDVKWGRLRGNGNGDRWLSWLISCNGVNNRRYLHAGIASNNFKFLSGTFIAN